MNWHTNHNTDISLLYISSVETSTSPKPMTIIDQAISYADALTDDYIDYGTGYYLTHQYSDGSDSTSGPFHYEEDAATLSPLY